VPEADDRGIVTVRTRTVIEELPPAVIGIPSLPPPRAVGNDFQDWNTAEI
jgi:hypothetical protein